MNNKQKVDPILLAAAAVALIATVYVFYITVFEQLISQSQGYFYAVIFGFILLVLFLLCNLFTKLIAISVGEQRTAYRKLITTIALVIIATLFLVTRLRYSTSLYPGEYPIYRGAVAMAEGNYSESRDLVESANANPAQYLCSFILSVLFRFTEPSAGPFLWMNAFFIILCGFLTYKIVRTFTNQMCGIFAAFLCAVIPSQTFAVYSFKAEPVVAAIFLGAVYALISLFSYNKRIKEIEDYGEMPEKDIAGHVFTVIGALLIGLLIFVEPFMILPMALMVLVANLSKKAKAFNMLIAFAAGIVIMVLLCFVKSVHMDIDFGTVMKSEVSAFDPATNYNTGQVDDFGDVFTSFNNELASMDSNITENYIFITDNSGGAAYTEMSANWMIVLNQIMYMFVLMMTISCMILAVKESKDYVVTISMLIFGTVVMLLFQQNRDSQKFLFITIFIIASSTGIHYLYLDHHPELKVSINALDALEKTGRKEIAAATRSNLKNAAQMTEADFVRRAKALIFVGNDEDLYNQIKNEEHERSLKYFNRAEKKEAKAFDDYDDDFFLDKEDDASDSIKITAVAPSGIRQAIGGENVYEPNLEMHDSASAALENPSVPAWKRPEQFGDEVMFDEDELELDKEHSSFEGRDALMASAGITTNEPAPEVEKIKRNTKKVVAPKKPKRVEPVEDDRLSKAIPKHVEEPEKEIPAPVVNVVKAEKPVKVKKEKPARSAEPSATASSGGKAVRRIKTVGSSGGAKTVSSVARPVKAVAKAAVEPEPSKPIPNPLPIPKKKEHKPMDYDKKVKKGAGEDWDFDVDVSDDDDWDV
ncbi:MAG: dolichyl-diphosphooligosaccharide--protein glycosyltransferase subunit STT3 [Lachnospiraceae bacterium]|nr:dolichyl-diphosphooligosaccharide--protein glycosyltransferase subunit STT3 [Lachnospiraceae bacterium]